MIVDKLKAIAEARSDQAWKSAEELRGPLMELESTLEVTSGKNRALTPRENELVRVALTIVLGEVALRRAVSGDESSNS